MIRRRRRANHAMPEISLTPLIDTALVLLVIFMIATPIMQNSINIDLPKGQMKEDEQTQKTDLVVSVDANQTIRLQNVAYSLDDLMQELARRAGRAKETKVYVQCDQKVSSGLLIKIIDSIKYVAGVEHVVLSTEKAR